MLFSTEEFETGDDVSPAVEAEDDNTSVRSDSEELLSFEVAVASDGDPAPAETSVRSDSTDLGPA